MRWICALPALAVGWACLLGIGYGAPVTNTAADSPGAVKETAERTVAVDAETQKAVDAWAAEEKQLLGRIDRAERALARVAWEREQTREYRETLEAKMAELKAKAAEMETIRAELLPVLDRGLNRLTAFVEADIPFARTVRLERMADTAGVLKDYDAGLLAKTRALFDTLAREVDFGYSVDVRETDIPVEGRPTRVKLLKVGRVGLYALTMDAERAYVWDGISETYRSDEQHVRAIDEAIQMVERIRLIELTRLPMGRPSVVPGQ